MARLARQYGRVMLYVLPLVLIAAFFALRPHGAEGGTAYSDPFWTPPSNSECSACSGCGCPSAPEFTPEGVSARTGEGTDTLLAETRARLPEGPPLFDADELTDRPLRFIVKELIREPLIMQLGQELPYNAAVHVDHWAEGERGGLVIHATIVVNKKSHKPIVVGKGGARIKAIGQAARERIERYLERKMFLDLRVKVDEDWIERPASLKELGYDEK